MRRKEGGLKSEAQAMKTPIPSINIKSPKKIEPQAETKRSKPTPIKNMDGSQQNLSMSDRQQLLALEIQQLKRQNNFLKKKIGQMNIQLSERQGSKRPKEKQKRPLSPSSLEVMPLSINIVFEQINNILNTIVKLFRIEFTEEDIADYNKKGASHASQQCPIKKHALFKKYFLKQRLERIMLEKEDQRFPILVDLFKEYYSEKQQYDQKIVKIIDDLTLKTHQLNQMILKKVQDKKKEKGTFSTIKKEEQIQVQVLKTPTSTKNFIAQNKMLANSPTANRNGKKLTRFPLSPTEKVRQSDI